jgi:hypothetical protein
MALASRGRAIIRVTWRQLLRQPLKYLFERTCIRSSKHRDFDDLRSAWRPTDLHSFQQAQGFRRPEISLAARKLIRLRDNLVWSAS